MHTDAMHNRINAAAGPVGGELGHQLAQMLLQQQIEAIALEQDIAARFLIAQEAAQQAQRQPLPSEPRLLNRHERRRLAALLRKHRI
jgi:hypothetical protein